MECLMGRYFLEPRDSNEFYSFKVAITWVLPCLSVVIGALLLLFNRLWKFYYLKVFLVLPGFSWLFYLNMMIFVNPRLYWKQWFILVPLLLMSFVVLLGTFKHVKVFRD